MVKAGNIMLIILFSIIFLFITIEDELRKHESINYIYSTDAESFTIIEDSLSYNKIIFLLKSTVYLLLENQF